MSRRGPNEAALECAVCEAAARGPEGSCEDDGEEKVGTQHRELLFLILAVILGLAALLIRPPLRDGLVCSAYLVAGWQVLLGAVRGIRRGKVFGELFLMSIATLGAIAIGYYEEAVAVMVFYRLGELLQESATKRSRASVRSLLDLRPDRIRVKSGGVWVEIPPDEAKAGDRFLVKPGERIGLDGRVIEGEAFLDFSALTGESLPRSVAVGSNAPAGCISLDGSLLLEAQRTAKESSAARIAGLVEEAAAKKAHTEGWITRFAVVYTPVVVGLAAAVAVLPPLFVDGQRFSVWAYRALVMLVISCPCALVLSVPLAYFCGIGGCALRGILVKGAQTLEILADVGTVVFDKTGTLTEGSFRVVDISPAGGRTEEELLALAAAAESLSRHPMATSIRSAAAARGLSMGIEDEASEIREIPGAGVVARVGRARVIAGNDRLLHIEGVPHERCDPEGSVVNVAVNSVFAGSILLGDELKADASAAVRSLAALGVERTVILTGDTACSARPVADELGIDELYADLLPEDKIDRLRQIGTSGTAAGRTVFVGDGINDAPVLAATDLGIAMGSGSDAAIESADLVLMTDEPARVGEAIYRARRTRKIVAENIVFALAAKAFLLGLGAFGLADMWIAVIGDVGVALAAVANSLRALGRSAPAAFLGPREGSDPLTSPRAWSSARAPRARRPNPRVSA
ncbi:MAG: heavy metal translocating P-type ATPase [Rectinemataceae bacterium]